MEKNEKQLAELAEQIAKAVDEAMGRHLYNVVGDFFGTPSVTIAGTDDVVKDVKAEVMAMLRKSN